jgi:hypothetical protein
MRNRACRHRLLIWKRTRPREPRAACAWT